jgi:hypothetical protein
MLRFRPQLRLGRTTVVVGGLAGLPHLRGPELQPVEAVVAGLPAPRGRVGRRLRAG